MKRVFNILLVSALILGGIPCSIHAQLGPKEVGDKFFEELAFSKAIPLYERVVDRNFDPDALIKLAQCYQLTNDYDNAFKVYEKVMELDEKPDVSFLYFGELLLQQGEAERAREMFLEYDNLNPQDTRGKAYVQDIENMATLLDNPFNYRVDLLPFNSKESDFGGFVYNEAIVFSSSRKGSFIRKDFDWVDENFLDLYYVPLDEDSWEDPANVKRLTGGINSPFHESSFSVSGKSGLAFFDRNSFLKRKKGVSKDGVVKLEIYQAQMDEFDCSTVNPFKYNNEEYNVSHPSLSSDGGQMYFVSNQPGGYGGADIYMTIKNSGKWAKPVNLGPIINTPGDDLFPFIHNNGTLYFSSNGHGGLGQLDVFFSEVRGTEWSEPKNMGSPINSPYDDFSFSVDETKYEGFVSSNRPDGMGGDDIYRVRDNRPLVEIIVRNKNTLSPLKNAEITVEGFGGEMQEFVTDINGSASYVSDYDLRYTGTVRTDRFGSKTLEITTPFREGKNRYQFIVEFDKEESFDLTVVDLESRESIPEAKVKFIHRKIVRNPLVRETDDEGHLEITFEREMEYLVQVTKEGYLNYEAVVGRNRDGYFGERIIPLQRIDADKTIVLENIKYDYAKWDIRPDAEPDLKYVIELMTQNPTIKVQLSSHTDSRGPGAYNLKLSQNRAKSARQYIVQNGIDADRIVGVGFGETKLVNDCVNGFPCSEAKHQENRRTEIKIIGTIEGVDNRKSFLDTSNNP